MHPEDEPVSTENRSTRPKHVWPILAAVLAVVIGLGYGVRERERSRELANSQQAMSDRMSQLQNQLQEMTDRVSSLVAAQQQAARERAATPAPTRKPAAARAAVARREPDDPRWKKVEGQLSENADKIASTQQQVERTREDLEGNLNSTRNDLNGSIARTHEELVALQRQGERDFQEFKLTKSREFRRVGPLSLALRKADTKHKRFDLELLVDDIKLQKKNVNLYEPFYITMSDRPRPVEVVVNRINRDQVEGYLILLR
jgi:uncharacterized membrane-anchored protein YhcB (DUF1043 family)